MEHDERKPVHVSEALSLAVAEDLSGMSLEELAERINRLDSEISRIRAEMQRKQGSLSQAEKMFRK